ncbi:MAG: hypothetical protein GY794_00830 [bacterium]|nr:hypothetical protein [bacterium]
MAPKYNHAVIVITTLAAPHDFLMQFAPRSNVLLSNIKQATEKDNTNRNTRDFCAAHAAHTRRAMET